MSTIRPLVVQEVSRFLLRLKRDTLTEYKNRPDLMSNFITSIIDNKEVRDDDDIFYDIPLKKSFVDSYLPELKQQYQDQNINIWKVFKKERETRYDDYNLIYRYFWLSNDNDFTKEHNLFKVYPTEKDISIVDPKLYITFEEAKQIEKIINPNKEENTLFTKVINALFNTYTDGEIRENRNKKIIFEDDDKDFLNVWLWLDRDSFEYFLNNNYPNTVKARYKKFHIN